MQIIRRLVALRAQRVVRAATCCAAFAMLAAAAGCAHHRTIKPLEYTLKSPYAHVRTWAVAPIINLSGSRAFDPLRVSDELFEELQQVQNLNVLPVDKSLMAMQRLQMPMLTSAKSALQIAELLHADGIVVAAITAYNPYTPPTVGMDIQLYSVRGARPGRPVAPVAQVSALFNAANRTVRMELKNFATGRSGADHTMGRRRYLVDVDAYMRFVCHAMAQRLLLQVQAARSNGR